MMIVSKKLHKSAKNCRKDQYFDKHMENIMLIIINII